MKERSKKLGRKGGVNGEVLTSKIKKKTRRGRHVTFPVVSVKG